MRVETVVSSDVMTPIGPYSHVAKAGPLLWIAALAGVDPQTQRLAGPDVYSQARQILRSFRVLLEGAGSSMSLVTHVHVFLKRVEDFEEMNRAYSEAFGAHLPARTVVAVADLPKAGALLTMNATAVVDDAAP
jgi:2-iminobutanoate/2-iminopropanoate deaminase